MDNTAFSKLIQCPHFCTTENGELVTHTDWDVQMRTDFNITYILITLE